MKTRIKDFIKYLGSFKENIDISLCILLIITDFVFILFNIYFKLYTPRVPDHLIISADYSYAEMFQYIKETWIVILIFYAAIKSKEFGYLSWVLIYSYLLFDDSLQIHEKIGGIIANNLESFTFLGLMPRDFGELAVTAITGIILLSTIIYFYTHGSIKFKSVSRDLFILLLLITFFGVFVDMIHATSNNNTWYNFALSIIEDGGEMIAMSIALAYVFNLNKQN